MRVCHLSKYYPPAVGGMETYVQTLAKAQAESGLNVTVFCLHHLETPTVVENDGPIKLIRFQRKISFAKLDFCPGLVDAIKAYDGDVIHLHSPNPTMILAALLARTKLPIVVTYQSDHVKQKIRGLLFRPLEILFGNKVKVFLATSPSYAEGSSYLKHYSGKTQVVPMGIDLEPFLNPSSKARDVAEKLRAKYKDPIWLCCGRLVYYKGMQFAIEALKTTPGTLFIAGDGPLRDALQAQANRLGLNERVVFLGSLSREEIIPYYLAARALWFSSCTRAEAFGLVQVEAMATGCPIINTSIPISGGPWVSPHDQTGLTVPQKDPSAISQAALRLLNENGLRDRFAENARRRALAEFSVSEMVKRTTAVYEKVLTQPLKILYLNPTGIMGGAERCLIDLLISVKNHLPNVEAQFLEIAPGLLSERVRQLGISVSSLPLPKRLAGLGDSAFKNKNGQKPSLVRFLLSAILALPSAVIYVIQLRSFLVATRPAIIHSNGLKTGLLVRLTGYRKAKILWHLHDFVGSRALMSRLVSWASIRVSSIVTNSDAVATDVSRFVSNIPVCSVHNGIDITEFSPGTLAGTSNGEFLDRLSGMQPEGRETLRIGMVATYAHWKGHNVFLSAAGKLRSAYPTKKLRFYIVGGPIYQTGGSQVSEDELRAIAGSEGISADVGFIPHQEKIADIYRALDIVVHASTEPEPFGRVIIEAMACEKPVIVSAAGGATELFTDGEDALGFSPNDSKGLAEQMRTLIENPALRKTLGAQGRKTVVAKFSRDRYTSEIANCYRSLEKKEKRGQPRRDLVVAMGYLEDNWHSSRHIAKGMFQALSKKISDSPHFKSLLFHFPSCKKARPRWIDRRVLYAKTLPSGNLLQLMDHSYGDALLTARRDFNYLSVLIHDVAFWRYRSPLNQFFRKRIVKGLSVADCRIAVSQSTAQEVEKELGLTVHAVIPSGLPIELFSHSDKARDPSLLLHVGGVDERKGIDRLLRLLAALPSSYRLTHVGERFTKTQRKMIAQLGIANRIEEKGYLDSKSLVALYHTASALICPSRYEGFGLPVIEARLCGTAVVTSKTVPALEHLQHDMATLVCDFEAFDTQRPSLRQQNACNAFLSFKTFPLPLQNREYFSWDRAAADYRKLYERLLSSKVGELPSRRYVESSDVAA
jgi:glycosyltransferase involved in cell wall biosynthesis